MPHDSTVAVLDALERLGALPGRELTLSWRELMREARLDSCGLALSLARLKQTGKLRYAVISGAPVQVAVLVAPPSPDPIPHAR